MDRREDKEHIKRPHTRKELLRKLQKQIPTQWRLTVNSTLPLTLPRHPSQHQAPHSSDYLSHFYYPFLPFPPYNYCRPPPAHHPSSIAANTKPTAATLFPQVPPTPVRQPSEQVFFGDFLIRVKRGRTGRPTHKDHWI